MCRRGGVEAGPAGVVEPRLRHPARGEPASRADLDQDVARRLEIVEDLGLLREVAGPVGGHLAVELLDQPVEARAVVRTNAIEMDEDRVGMRLGVGAPVAAFPDARAAIQDDDVSSSARLTLDPVALPLACRHAQLFDHAAVDDQLQARDRGDQRDRPNSCGDPVRPGSRPRNECAGLVAIDVQEEEGDRW